MKLHTFLNDHKEVFCQYRFPNQWVVVVNVYGIEDDPDGFHYTQKVCEELGLERNTNDYPFMVADELYIECDNEDDARRVFKMFPEEKAGYTVMFGPVPEMFRSVATRIQQERGMILTENT